MSFCSDNHINSFCRFELNGSTMVFMLNLAMCDLLYCTTSLPIYAKQHISGKIGLNHTFCKIFAVLRNINVETDFMAIGMIAISRLVHCINGNTKSFMDKYKIAFVAGTWIYGIVIVVARYLMVMFVKNRLFSFSQFLFFRVHQK